MAITDLTQQRFGRLTVVGPRSVINGRGHWASVCDCGAHALPRSDALTSGAAQSCGCLQKETAERLGTASRTHGHRIRRTPTYNAWAHMIDRCLSPKNSRYSDYGGRGIEVCDRWLSFEAFLEDMGDKPAGLTLERKNNEKGYSPENCVWATYIEQNRNRRPFGSGVRARTGLQSW